ncbi:MAG TPA: hypothetical protein ENJ82_14505 [Bacteroidetes bacterium]|nr:hypothetical protein [Bacteroidota bacterium]
MNTFSSNSNWMAQMGDEIAGLTLRQLVIPGTHDSGTYAINKHSDYSPDAPSFIKELEKLPILPNLIKGIVAGWARTQGLDWTAQLNAGIRYLDIRTCLNTDDNQMYIVHTMYGGLLSDLIAAVKAFATANPKEIILLDFNHFYEMTAASHKQLVGEMLTAFGSKMVPAAAGLGTKVSDLWKAEQQVIVLYDDTEMVSANAQLWSQNAIQSPWPNVQSVDALKTALDKEVADLPGEVFFVLQGILTENTELVVQGLLPGNPGTLEELEAITSPKVVGWVQNEWNDVGLNIVIIDWFQTTNYLEVIKSIQPKLI